MEARRKEIVSTAQDLIVRKGYRDLSLREVARECGMSAPGLIHHFPTLDSLLEAVLEHRDETDLAAIGAGDATDLTLADVIDSAINYYAERPDDQRMFDALETEALDPTHPAHEWFVKRNEQVTERLRPLLEKEFADPETALRLLRYLLDGMRLNRAQNPDQPNFAVEAKTIYAVLQHGLEGV
ncbi:TetR/AcrR family transcriptional regulator [Leifsonia sp. NPDC058248]|uniref:TetR/AcrR family transcriptional regulator n=1 Tax=Leifsonia sp. NPDC058248 TaxID=3346402 RepID=UPI0036DD8D31